MIFTASDVSSVSQSLHHWEIAEYVFEGVVIVACAGELVADLGRKCLRKIHRDRIERCSTFLLVAALSLELTCLVKTNELSGNAIGSLGEKAEEADGKAKTAIADSSAALSQAKDALTKAGKAAESLGNAEDKANQAQAASSNSLTLARGARQEADSFAKDIVSAKEQAAKAESHLAEALQRVKEAQLSLDKLRSPRRLTPEQQKLISAKLMSFPGIQFDLALTNLEEPAQFSLTLEKTLGMGGWTEIDWVGGDIVSTRPSGPRTGFITATGVVVQMHKEQVVKFWSAATALVEALKAEGIDAKAEQGVGPKNENNKAIHILVGEKPMQ